MPFSIRGPKGHLVVREASTKRITKTLPALVKRFGRVTIAPGEPDQAKAVAGLRARILDFCAWSIKHEKDWHYAQERPMERLKTPAQLEKLPRTADCSEHATDAYAFADAPDPNGQDFSGTGFTGTILEHCRHIQKHDAQPGDLAVFGVAPGHHVVVLLEDGTANAGDPYVCSHGQEKGPVKIRLSAEALAQPVPITFLTCL